MLTITESRPSAKSSAGSAALEALFLVVILVIPVWTLLFNMGYLGQRVQDAQEVTRLVAYDALARRTKGEDLEGKSSVLENGNKDLVFPGESNPIAVTVTESNVRESFDDSEGVLDSLGNLVAGMSGNTRVRVGVARNSPYGTFQDSGATGDSAMTVGLTIGGTPYTYCQVENASFDPFEGENIDMGILSIIAGGSSWILAPFGGKPLGDKRC